MTCQPIDHWHDNPDPTERGIGTSNHRIAIATARPEVASAHGAGTMRSSIGLKRFTPHRAG